MLRGLTSYLLSSLVSLFLLVTLYPAISYGSALAIESVEWKTDHADSIFIGRVIEISDVKFTETISESTARAIKRVTIEVLETLKGAKSPQLSFIYQYRDRPDAYLLNGEETLFFLARSSKENLADNYLPADSVLTNAPILQHAIDLDFKERIKGAGELRPTFLGHSGVIETDEASMKGELLTSKQEILNAVRNELRRIPAETSVSKKSIPLEGLKQHGNIVAFAPPKGPLLLIVPDN